MLEQPIYSKDNKVIITPVGLALARNVQALGDSYLINLQSATTFVRVYAISKDVYLKWATSDENYCTAGNFDEVVIAGQYVDFGVPTQTDGKLFSRMTFVGRESGATVIVIEK